MLPHLLDIRLTDDGEVASLKGLPLFTPRKILVLISIKSPSQSQGHNADGGIRSSEKFDVLIGN
jgi:hypothetical protein